MTERGIQQTGDVFILQGIHTLAPNAFHANERLVAQNAELMGNRALLDSELLN